jgi:hypothetical protein
VPLLAFGKAHGAVQVAEGGAMICGAAVTVTGTVNEYDPSVAVMLAVPTLTPVTTGELPEIVATLGVSLLHDTKAVAMSVPPLFSL